MDFKKTVQIFFFDADTTKRVKASVSGSMAVAYKVPKNCVSLCSDKPEFNYSGIYFLVGRDEDGHETFYVGQADKRKNKKGIINRALEPHDGVGEWQTVIAITAKDDSLGSTKICYLENKFRNLAVSAGRSIVKNGNEPSIGNPTEEEAAEMDEFISHVLLLVGAMGYKFFESIDKTVSDTPKEDILTYSYLGLVARGIATDDSFILLKGSQLRDLSECKESAKKTMPKLREQYKNVIKNNVLTEDIVLNSSSQAAMFCVLSSASGNVCWKK